MRLWKVLLIAAVSSGLLASCSKVEKSSTALEEAEEESTAPATDTSLLFLYVQAKYEGMADSTYQTVGNPCLVPVGTADGTDVPCTISVPELKLYYSDLKFVVGTNSALTCKQVSFQPYFYQRDTIVGFVDGTNTGIDCSGAGWPTEAGCYAGAAPGLLGSDFPLNFSEYFLTDNTLTQSWTTASLNTLRGEKPLDPSYKSQAGNTNIANNLVTRTNSFTYLTDGFNYSGSGRYQDYQVTCRDEYAHLKYSITLIISDNDTPTAEGTEDELYDWD